MHATPESRANAELVEHAGVYESPGNRIELTLGDEGRVLRSVSKVALAKELEPKPPPLPAARIAFCGVDRVPVLDGPTRNTQGEFLRGHRGVSSGCASADG